ncbi:hypothetical protein [Acinetobacter marinus]|nr:hypothetical protein [Acinetobacter marinus]
MNNDILEQHPCKNKCPNFTDEQCCHYLVKETRLSELMDSALKSRDQARESAVALKEEAHKHFGGEQ